MVNQIDIRTFMQKRLELPVIDVRSPGEFIQGHIPGAVNIPLFNDEERSIVGTKYKRENKEAAMFAALGFVGPKMTELAKAGIKTSNNREVLVHCWRGGMRSSSMAWLFSTVGLTVHLLEGGYRNYRRNNRDFISAPFSVRILGGSTGSGKTAILNELKKLGEQVIDLEGLAKHKGSAFGALGEEPQPTTEHFENLLADELRKIDRSKPVWIEDESRNIGRCVIPEPFYFQMKEAPVFELRLDRKIRAERLIVDYAKFPDEELIACIEKISKRLGGDRTNEAIEAVKSKDYYNTAMITLEYYDKAYTYSLEKNHQGIKIPVTSVTAEPAKNATLLMDFARKNGL